MLKIPIHAIRIDWLASGFLFLRGKNQLDSERLGLRYIGFIRELLNWPKHFSKKTNAIDHRTSFFFVYFFGPQLWKKKRINFAFQYYINRQNRNQPITVIHESSGHQVFVAISMFVRPKTTEIIKNQQRQIHKIQVHKHSTFFICFCWISHDEKY